MRDDSIELLVAERRSAGQGQAGPEEALATCRWCRPGGRAKTGWRCMGFHSGRASMSCAREVHRAGPRRPSRRHRVRPRSRSARSCRGRPAAASTPSGPPKMSTPSTSANSSRVAAPPRASAFEHPGKALELGPPEGGQQVGHPVVVADLGVLVVRRPAAAPGWRDSGCAAAISGSSHSRAPPPEVVMILLPLKDTIAATPSEPARRPSRGRRATRPRRRGRERRAVPRRRAIARVVGDLADAGPPARRRPRRRPGARWSSSACSTSAGSRLPVSSESTKTGVAPV